MISADALIETPEQLRQFAQAASRDVREEAGPLVAALAYGGVCRDAEDRIALATELLELTQLTSSDLRTLATTIGFSNVSEVSVTEFLDALLDHHAMCPEVTVALFHNHSMDSIGSSPALCNPGDLSVAVARATAGKNVVRSTSAIKFIEHVHRSSPAGVSQQLAHLLDAGEWSGSLWAAYAAAAAIQDAHATPVTGALEDEWHVDLDPPNPNR